MRVDVRTNPDAGMLRYILFLGFMLSIVGTRDISAATRIIDRIDVEVGSEFNDINLQFNIPVRLISQVPSSSGRELNIQVQPTITPGSEDDVLSRDEVLSWNPSAEVPLDTIRFRPRGIATSRLELSFSAPVAATVVQSPRDFFTLTIRLQKRKKVERVLLDEPPAKPPTEIRPESTHRAPITAVPLPPSQAEALQGDFVVNLLSQTRPIDFSEISPATESEGTRLYTTKAEINGKTWYRLRMGFFADLASAEQALKEIRRFHPEAWIDRATAEEKKKLSVTASQRSKTPSQDRAPPIRLPKAPAPLPSTERQARMMRTARKFMTAGDYPKAIRLLTAILELPEHSHTQEAQELLGLARERNNQFTHAFAEYQKYLEKYPEGEDAERVRQRLAGLLTATKKPRQPLRKPRQQRDKSLWDLFGSVSVAYRYDGIASDLVEESTTRSQVDSDIFLSARRAVAGGNLRTQFTGGYSYDLQNDGPGDVSTLSDAYVEFDHRATKASGKIGRQRLRSSGILNRFDGLVVGYAFSRDIEARLSLGIPVEKSSDTFIRDDKRFVGASVELDSIFENVDVNLFFVEQDIEGLVDRRAIGGEIRYFKDDLSVFGLLDYDAFYNVLNTALVQTNWNYTPETALYLILDYRLTPTLTTANAIIGQTDSKFSALKASFSEGEIHQLARDRTARSRIVSAGGTHTLASDLQLSGDITVSHVGPTPASGGVAATESTGNEFFYTIQLAKPNLIKNGDIGILSLRYNDSSTSDTVTLSANSRYPVTSALRINPRLTAAHRVNKSDNSDRTTFGGFLQGDYRLKKDLLLEGEAGVNWYDEDEDNGAVDFADYFFRIGFRWEF